MVCSFPSVSWCWVKASSLSLSFSCFSTALPVAFLPSVLLLPFIPSFYLPSMPSLASFFSHLFPSSLHPHLPAGLNDWFTACLAVIYFPVHNYHCTMHLFPCLHRINSANGLEIKSTGTQSLLMVANVTEEHYGNYTCVAANKLGVTNASLYLYSKYGRG